MAFVSNKVISDYSAVIYEVAVIGKPMIFYAYDKNNYVDSRNFYLNYDKEMPGKICLTLEELFKEIDNINYEKSKIFNFRKKYVEECETSYTCDIVKFIKFCVR